MNAIMNAMWWTWKYRGEQETDRHHNMDSLKHFQKNKVLKMNDAEHELNTFNPLLWAQCQTSEQLRTV